MIGLGIPLEVSLKHAYILGTRAAGPEVVKELRSGYSLSLLFRPAIAPISHLSSPQREAAKSSS